MGAEEENGIDRIMRALGFQPADEVIREMRSEHDKHEMSLEQATQRIRLFIEQLTDEQLSDLSWMLGLMSADKSLVHVFRGACIADHWRRTPFNPADVFKRE